MDIKPYNLNSLLYFYLKGGAIMSVIHTIGRHSTLINNLNTGSDCSIWTSEHPHLHNHVRVAEGTHGGFFLIKNKKTPL